MPRLLVGSRVKLLPVTSEHYEYLRRTEIERLGIWWRNRGVVQSPEEFERRIWAGILHQFIVIGLVDDIPLAWLQCYNADPVNGTAAISVARVDDRLSSSLRFASGLAMFFEYCFTTHGFRKLYMEVAGPNLEQFGSTIGPLFVEEGRLAGHIRTGDTYCDLHLLALWDFNWSKSDLRTVLLDRA
jgi:hypothetical protein